MSIIEIFMMVDATVVNKEIVLFCTEVNSVKEK